MKKFFKSPLLPLPKRIHASHWLYWLLLLTTCALPGTGASTEKMPVAGPLLRIESGMHTSMLRRVGMDAEERYLFSIADDKTLRVWSMENGRLLLTFRVPIGLTTEGSLFALAISPDGRTVAVSGQTCPEWDDTYCIYLIDVKSGKLRRRITNLPEAVTHLAFSPTGTYLAATFGEKAGLRVYGIPDGAPVYLGEPYNVPANWVDFAPDGRLVTSAYDGMLRLYDASFRLLLVKQLARLSKPYGVAFSPDGTKVAVGFRDRNTVAVLSGSDLSLLYLPDVTGVQNHLWVVAWSRDGRTLYGGGGHLDKGRYLIRWWSQAGEANQQGRGEYIDVPASRATVTHLLALQSGG
ncbi:MAG: hypothetical protein HQM02_05520, partial [Magnetococcales bacterium]|nr:hypothetical protein [Magnetococcales bacterium]